MCHDMTEIFLNNKELFVCCFSIAVTYSGITSLDNIQNLVGHAGDSLKRARYLLSYFLLSQNLYRTPTGSIHIILNRIMYRVTVYG